MTESLQRHNRLIASNFNAQCGLLKTLEEEMDRATGPELLRLAREYEAEKRILAAMPLP